MYSNIGKKIKALAKIICIVYATLLFVGGVITASSGANAVGAGVAIMIVGPVFAWVSSFFLYGFGELIDKACEIERNTRGGAQGQASEDVKKESIELAEETETQEHQMDNEFQEQGENECKAAMINREDNRYAYTVCPDCSREIFFYKGTQEAKCPYCGCKMVVKK